MAILAGVPMAAGLWLIAPGLIVLVFGQEFVESIGVLRTLSGLVLLTFLTHILGTFLMSCDREVEWTTTNSIVALFNVVGNVLLIPAFGVQGAAVSTLLSQILLFFFTAARLKSVVGWPRVSTRLAISGAGSVSFCLVFTVLPAMSLVVVIPACVLLYVIFLLLFKDIRANEVRFLLDMVNR